MASASTPSTVLRTPVAHLSKALKLKCDNQIFRKWEAFNKQNKTCIYTTEINHGCFVVAFVSNDGIYIRHDGQLSPYAGTLSVHSNPLYDHDNEDQIKKWTDKVVQETIDHYGTFKDTLSSGKLFVVVPKNAGDNESQRSRLVRQRIEALIERVTLATRMEARLLHYDIVENSVVPDYAALEVNMDTRKNEMPHPEVLFNGTSWWE